MALPLSNGSSTGLELATLAERATARSIRWGGCETWTGADWSNALCGEAGEAANVVKKLRRAETAATPDAYSGESVTTTDRDELIAKLGSEIADVLIYAVLLAAHYNIDVEGQVRDKFNRVSVAQGFPERL
jgi:NTP pyrophosphatase (non-canonical NTP hydrolase)